MADKDKDETEPAERPERDKPVNRAPDAVKDPNEKTDGRPSDPGQGGETDPGSG